MTRRRSGELACVVAIIYRPEASVIEGVDFACADLTVKSRKLILGAFADARSRGPGK